MLCSPGRLPTRWGRARTSRLVLVALQNAFYQLLHADSLEEGVVDTVMAGGDTDTNACIAGALLGACHGLEAIPERWREAILACRRRKGFQVCAGRGHGSSGRTTHSSSPVCWSILKMVMRVGGCRLFIMSTISFRLPESLHRRVRELAKAEDVSINQLITTALAEKMSALMTVDYLEGRAARDDRGAFERAMTKVRDSEPEEGDV